MGSQYLYLRLPILPTGPINFSSSGDNTIIPAIAFQRIGIHRIWLKAAGATVLTFKDGATNLSGPVSLATNDEIKFDLSGEPWMTVTAGNPFIINSTNAVQVGGIVYYFLSSSPTTVGSNSILLEDGTYMLLEDGTKITVEP